MKKETIISAIEAILNPEDILSIEVDLNQYNQQPDCITVIFKEDTTSDLKLIGPLIDMIDDLVADDGYGDLTGLDFRYSTYHELPNGEFTISYTFENGIDS